MYINIGEIFYWLNRTNHSAGRPFDGFSLASTYPVVAFISNNAKTSPKKKTRIHACMIGPGPKDVDFVGHCEPLLIFTVLRGHFG